MKSSRHLSIFLLMASACAGSGEPFAQDATRSSTVNASLAENQSDDPQRTAYESWVHRYESGPLRGALGDNHQIKFTITAVEGDDRKPDDKTSSLFGPEKVLPLSVEFFGFFRLCLREIHSAVIQPNVTHCYILIGAGLAASVSSS